MKENILCIIIGIMAITFIFLIVLLRSAYHKKLDNLNVKFTALIDDMEKRIPTITIDKRLEFNIELLHFIDAMVELEVINQKRFDIFLDKPSKDLDVDRVLQDVSKKIFESLKPEIYTAPDNIVTAEYLMDYIQKKTFITYFTYLKNKVAEQL